MIGGRRPGAGRKPGSANRKTREIADRAASEGLLPLEYLLSVMRNSKATMAMRLDAAKAAAPYIHPRLSTVEMQQDVRIHETATKEQRDAAVAAALRADE